MVNEATALLDSIAENGGRVVASGKALDTDVMKRSVQDLPKVTSTDGSGGGVGDFFLLQLASVSDEIIPWGLDPAARDRQLRQFFPTEATLLSAVSQVAARNAAFSWTVKGPERTAARYQKMLQQANFGEGWAHYILSLSIDILTQDNGAFTEIIRASDNPTSEVIGIASLDAGLCRRTGDPRAPVVYLNPDTMEYHLLQWWQVAVHTEMPSPLRSKKGLQFCAVTRVLRAAQILRDIAVYRHEQVTGRHIHKIDVVSGLSKLAVDTAVAEHTMNADQEGRLRYMKPLVIPTIDPAATVSHVEINLATLPDGFDEDKSMKWYINALANGFLTDYQEFAPLPGGGLGTSSQSETLHNKSRGKGPGLFKKQTTVVMNFKILPRSLEFEFDEKDSEGEMQEAAVRDKRAMTRKTDIESGVITVDVARLQAVDDGDLRPEYRALMGTEDADDDVSLDDEEQATATIQSVDEAETQAVINDADLLEPLAKALAMPGMPPDFDGARALIAGRKGAERPEVAQTAEERMFADFSKAFARTRAKANRILNLEAAEDQHQKSMEATQAVLFTLEEVRDAVKNPPPRVVTRTVTKRDPETHLIVESTEKEVTGADALG